MNPRDTNFITLHLGISLRATALDGQQGSSRTIEEISVPDNLSVKIDRASPAKKQRIADILREAEEEKEQSSPSGSRSPSPKQNRRDWNDDNDSEHPESDEEPIPCNCLHP